MCSRPTERQNKCSTSPELSYLTRQRGLNEILHDDHQETLSVHLSSDFPVSSLFFLSIKIMFFMQDGDLKQETKALSLAHEVSMTKTRVGLEMKVVSLNYWMFYQRAALCWQADLWWLCRWHASGGCHYHSGMQTKSSIVFGHGVSSISKTKLHLNYINYICFSMVRPLCHFLFFTRARIPFKATHYFFLLPSIT